MNLEERTRLAATRVPRPGLYATLLGRYTIPTLLGLVVGLLAMVSWLVREGETLGLKELLGLIAVTIAGLVYFAKQAIATKRMNRGSRLLFAGDLEEAGKIFHAMTVDVLLAPWGRVRAAEMLGVTATLGGHADRAIVLLRATADSKAMPFGMRSRLQASTATALLALGHPAEARALLAACKNQHELHVVSTDLLVNALGGTVEEARSAVGRFESQRALRQKLNRLMPGQTQYGSLVVAYVWDRAAQALPSGAQRDEVEAKRNEALRHARKVPPHFHGYLAAKYPAFDRFARAVPG